MSLLFIKGDIDEDAPEPPSPSADDGDIFELTEPFSICGTVPDLVIFCKKIAAKLTREGGLRLERARQQDQAPKYYQLVVEADDETMAVLREKWLRREEDEVLRKATAIARRRGWEALYLPEGDGPLVNK